MVGALTVAAAMSVAAAPAASASTHGCVAGARAAGVHQGDAEQACAEAAEGDVPDCVSMIEHDSQPPNNEIAAEDACNKAAPPAKSGDVEG
jgi:hypothetical protein